MKAIVIGSNAVLLSLNDQREILFSYGVPVAAFIGGRGYLRTKDFFSATTSKHINGWLAGMKATEVDQSELNSLLDQKE